MSGGCEGESRTGSGSHQAIMPAHRALRRGHHASLAADYWPTADRLAWQAARRPGQRLKRGGRAGHLRQTTATSMERAYGYFLEFLKRAGGLDTDMQQPCVAITQENIRAFLEELHDRVASVTRHTYLQRIHRMAVLLVPDADWIWLNEIVLDLKDQAIPRSKASRIVSSDRLLKLGLDLIARAATSRHRTRLQRAQLHRNGLMIALLALCPIRLKNLASLEIGRQLVDRDGNWWICLTVEETKTGRIDERPVPEILSEAISDRLTSWKPCFHLPSNDFWASTKGGGLAYTYVGTIITKTTRKELGVAVNPHLFRDCAVHTIAHNAGNEMGMASALLQHTDPRITQKHYSRGASIEAVKAFHDLLGTIPEK